MERRHATKTATFAIGFIRIEKIPIFLYKLQ